MEDFMKKRLLAFVISFLVGWWLNELTSSEFMRWDSLIVANTYVHSGGFLSIAYINRKRYPMDNLTLRYATDFFGIFCFLSGLLFWICLAKVYWHCSISLAVTVYLCIAGISFHTINKCNLWINGDLNPLSVPKLVGK